MFDSYVLLKTMTVLIVVARLGMDFGTFVSYARMRDSPCRPTRKQMFRGIALIDVGLFERRR